MPQQQFRSLFISHGAPSLALDDVPARSFLLDLGRRLARPRAIVALSPHWMTSGFELKAPPRFGTWHDFYGFGEALYQQRYEPPGDAALGQRVQALMAGAGMSAKFSTDKRLDHGVWAPLSLLFPKGDVPLVQVSLAHRGPAEVLALGQALAPLADEGVLLLGTGGLVHNLRELDAPGSAPPSWARNFEEWATARVLAGDWDALVAHRHAMPLSLHAHPTDEHLLPLFFAAGAGGEGSRTQLLHASWTYGSISMACFGFGDALR